MQKPDPLAVQNLLKNYEEFQREGGKGEGEGGKGEGGKGGGEGGKEGKGGFGRTASVTEKLKVKVLTGTGLPSLDGSNNAPSPFVVLKFDFFFFFS